MQALNLGQPASVACVAFKRGLAPLVREVSGIATERRRASLLGRLLGRDRR
jgi:hypothetical protein